VAGGTLALRGELAAMSVALGFDVDSVPRYLSPFRFVGLPSDDLDGLEGGDSTSLGVVDLGTTAAVALGLANVAMG